MALEAVDFATTEMFLPSAASNTSRFWLSRLALTPVEEDLLLMALSRAPLLSPARSVTAPMSTPTTLAPTSPTTAPETIGAFSSAGFINSDLDSFDCDGTGELKYHNDGRTELVDASGEVYDISGKRQSDFHFSRYISQLGLERTGWAGGEDGVEGSDEYITIIAWLR